jgi:hypothetical protein
MFGTKGKRPGRSSVLLSDRWFLLKVSFQDKTYESFISTYDTDDFPNSAESFFFIFYFYQHETISHPITNIFINLDSLDSPLSNDILLVFCFSYFHVEIIGLQK